MLLRTLLLPLLLLSTAHAATGVYEVGIKTTTPVALTPDNFETALADPQNPFWVLKFFAPWYVLLM